jgi:uncharacterized protein DUF6152
MTRLRMGAVLLGAALCMLGVIFAGVAAAHHAVQAQFDVKKKVTITGSVVKVEWINPHSYLTVDVKDADGKTQRWAFEMAGPGALHRSGMSRADRGGLKQGDQVTVSGLASKDGSNTGFMQELTFPDGRVFKFSADINGN